MFTKHLSPLAKYLVCLFLSVGMLNDCGPSQAEKEVQRKAAEEAAAAEKIAAEKATFAEAIKSLRKIKAGLEVGVNYAKFGELLIEAKTSVNETLLTANNEEAKKELTAVMDWFADAYTIWGKSIFEGDDIFDLYSRPLEILVIIDKYDSLFKQIKINEGHHSPKGVLNVFWFKASEALETFAKKYGT